MGASGGGHNFKKRTHNGHRPIIGLISKLLGANAAYSCPSSTDCNYALVIKTKSNSISASENAKTKTIVTSTNIAQCNYLTL